MMNEIVNNAREFAKQAHQGQLYGSEPYIVHLDEVATIVERYGDVTQIAAYLHDVLEDTQTTEEDIEELFDSSRTCAKVIRAVKLCTDETGKNRKERKAATNTKLSNAKLQKDAIGLIVKAADRLANARRCVMNNPDLFAIYAGEDDEFKKAAYRPGLCDEIWAELDSIFTER